jgi:hydrogenase maturation protease
MGKMLVLGVGNPFRRDDGIGPAVIQRLHADTHLEGIDLLDGGIDGFSLIDHIQGYAKVLVVDAVEMGEQPGAIRVFTPDEAIVKIQADALSTHGFGLAEVLAFMQKLDMRPEVRIIGIQANDVTVGEGMSPEVSSRIDDVLEVVKNAIEHG